MTRSTTRFSEDPLITATRCVRSVPTTRHPQGCAAEHEGAVNKQCKTASTCTEASERVCQQMMEPRRTKARSHDARQVRRCAPVGMNILPLLHDDSASACTAFRLLILQSSAQAARAPKICGSSCPWFRPPARCWSAAGGPAAWPRATPTVATNADKQKGRCCAASLLARS